MTLKFNKKFPSIKIFNIFLPIRYLKKFIFYLLLPSIKQV
jgi:hypothetical protein